jgi:anti-sigma B factor antagonist
VELVVALPLLLAWEVSVSTASMTHTLANPEEGLLRLSVSRPTSSATVVVIAGELDAATAPRLAAFLNNRLASTVTILVLDLSAVSFLGSAGLGVLIHARQRATAAGCDLHLITGTHCVDRALQITGIADDFACHPTPPSTHSRHER